MKNTRKINYNSRIKSILFYSWIQNIIANRYLILAAKNLAANPESSEKPIWKKINPHHIIAYITVITTLVAGFMSWNKEIITDQIAEVKAEKEQKIELQRKFNKSLLSTRVLIINQNSLCQIEHKSPILLKVERLNSLRDVAVLNSSIKNVFGIQAFIMASSITEDIYNIKDVCSLNAVLYDDQLHISANKLEKIFYDSIAKNNKEISDLTKKRRRMEFSIKV